MTSVDIILFCYKQEQYIEQALRSIYTQELPKNVSARIIVADDASPDNTLAIIKHHAPESPFPITFLPHEPNMGISKNYKRSFAATGADYVAILEGDDYWKPNHISQHVEFLQSHPECSMCMNELTNLFEATGEMICNSMVTTGGMYKLIDLHKQITAGNQLGNLSACAFRGQYLRELPSDLFDMPIDDWMLGTMMVERGYIGILKGSTSVYRVKANGAWAGRSPWQQHLEMLRRADVYDGYQKGKYHAEWSTFKKRCWDDVRRNWMHYLPNKIRKEWYVIKKIFRTKND